MKRVLLTLVVIAVVLIATVWTLLLFHERSCYQNTVYSERFSLDAYSRVKAGMPRSAVIELLGAPLKAEQDGAYPVWAIQDEAIRKRFGGAETIALDFLMFSQPKDHLHDFNWVQVSVGPDGTVVATRNCITD